MNNFIDSKEKVYPIPSSPTLINYIDYKHKKILDVGSGVGKQGVIIKNKFENTVVDSISISKQEQEICSKIYDNSFLIDIEKDGIESLIQKKYDLIIFSHVLEHISYPKKILQKFHQVLNDNGECFVVVPNFLHYLNRINLLSGKLNYTKEGIMDYTHLRLFSHKNSTSLLIDESLYTLKKNDPRGLHPNTILYKLLGNKITNYIDYLTLKISPGLFAEEFIIQLQKK